MVSEHRTLIFQSNNLFISCMECCSSPPMLSLSIHSVKFNRFNQSNLFTLDFSTKFICLLSCLLKATPLHSCLEWKQSDKTMPLNRIIHSLKMWFWLVFCFSANLGCEFGELWIRIAHWTCQLVNRGPADHISSQWINWQTRFWKEEMMMQCMRFLMSMHKIPELRGAKCHFHKVQTPLPCLVSEITFDELCLASSDFLLEVTAIPNLWSAQQNGCYTA